MEPFCCPILNGLRNNSCITGAREFDPILRLLSGSTSTVVADFEHPKIDAASANYPGFVAMRTGMNPVAFQIGRDITGESSFYKALHVAKTGLLLILDENATPFSSGNKTPT